MSWKTSAAALALLAATAFAQEIPGAEGPSSGPRLGDGPRAALAAADVAKAARAPSRRVTLAPLDVSGLLARDAEKASIPALRSDPRVGVIRRFAPLRAPRRLRSGARGVQTLADGSLVWTAEVHAPGALGLRLRLAQCELPGGATITAHDADEPAETYGPFAEDRFQGDRGAYLPSVFGERVRVELRVPAKSAGEALRLVIDRAAHRYRERGSVEESSHQRADAKPSTCNNNVACDPGYTQEIARAVATLEITSFDGVYLCSGALLNDSVAATSVPYFLTAHHCISTEFEANNTEFYFDYRAETCDGAPPPLQDVPRVVGSTMLATSSSTDFTLLRLTGTMPSNRYFCGWSAARQNASEAVVGVHHPGGTHMRISYGALLSPDGDFLRVQWSSGVTAGGSSGSPLFNAQRQVIGQLYGGASSCAFPQGIDEYGRFDRSYADIADFLGSGGSAGSGDAFDPADDTASGATVVVPRKSGVTHAPHTLSATDPADWFAFDLQEGMRYRFFSTGLDDVRATLYSDAQGSVAVATDDDSAGSGQFSIDFTAPATGRYAFVVTTDPLRGDADYALQFAEVSPRAARPAAPVGRLRAAVSSGIVTLRWQDRARNETGYYVERSSDDGRSWTRVAELPRGTRAYAHEPGPGRHVYRVGAWNVFPQTRWRKKKVDVTDANQRDASDPDDDAGAGATRLEPAAGGLSVWHTFSRVDVEDWFVIELAEGSLYTFESSGDADTYGELFDDVSGIARLVADDDSGARRNFRIVYAPTRSGAHWLRVSPYVEGAILTYVLEWRAR